MSVANPSILVKIPVEAKIIAIGSSKTPDGTIYPHVTLSIGQIHGPFKQSTIEVGKSLFFEAVIEQ